jgi:hypothetical protein
MKQFARSVPVILFSSVASLSLMALAGCGSSGNGGPTAAKSIYAIQNAIDSTTGVEQDSILVFSASATGSMTPTSTLMLPSGVGALSVAVGPTGTIYVGVLQVDSDIEAGQILEYPAGSSGSATPTVTLNGSDDGTTTFVAPVNMAVNSAGMLVVSSDDGTLEAFASGFTSSSAPTQYLTWGTTNFGDSTGTVGVDTAGEIFYGDPGDGEGDGVIDVFAAGATGATAPTRQITGTDTSSFAELEYLAVDGAGDVYAANYNLTGDSNDPPSVGTNPGTLRASKSVFAMGRNGASRFAARPLNSSDVTLEPTEILEFAAGATGNATPTKRIGGAATHIVEPEGLAVDAASNLYYADANGGYYSQTTPPSVLLEVFPLSATGNVAPAASITSTNYTYSNLLPPPSSGILFTDVAIH